MTTTFAIIAVIVVFVGLLSAMIIADVILDIWDE